MRMFDYQRFTAETAQYPEDVAIPYLVLGLAGEAGEVANCYKKALRDDDRTELSDHRKDKMLEEMGDCLWYMARLCSELGVNMDDVARDNLDKLRSRKQRGVIAGSGDGR